MWGLGTRLVWESETVSPRERVGSGDETCVGVWP